MNIEGGGNEKETRGCSQTSAQTGMWGLHGACSALPVPSPRGTFPSSLPPSHSGKAPQRCWPPAGSCQGTRVARPLRPSPVGRCWGLSGELLLLSLAGGQAGSPHAP